MVVPDTLNLEVRGWKMTELLVQLVIRKHYSPRQIHLADPNLTPDPELVAPLACVPALAEEASNPPQGGLEWEADPALFPELRFPKESNNMDCQGFLSSTLPSTPSRRYCGPGSTGREVMG